MIAAGAGHEIGKHRLLSDGVCAPGAGGRRRKAKNDCAAGPKTSEERGEERGKRRLRDQKSKQKYLKKQNKQQCTMQGTKTVFVFGACVPLGRGEKPQGKKWWPKAKKSGKTRGKNDVLCKEINSGAHLRSSKKPW